MSPIHARTTFNSYADQHLQVPKESNIEGIVRLFIINSNGRLDKAAVEKGIAKRMAELSNDNLWESLEQKVKVLTLEHHMAASRGGFIDFFNLFM